MSVILNYATTEQKEHQMAQVGSLRGTYKVIGYLLVTTVLHSIDFICLHNTKPLEPRREL